jgi:peptidoglycan hydrolase-like protein with peptidoglycan-binding domain
MAEFIPRLTRPEAGNKYYITRANGGYSDAIKGKPTDSACDVLHNCVGYAYGRFNEIGGHGYCKYLRPVNAEMFIEHCGGLEVGQTPKLGACMVWKKGATLSGSDGAGHVAIVEQIYSDTVIVTSESGYGSASPFWIQRRSKGDGNWGAGSGYTFLGFIYQPIAAIEKPVEEEKKPVDETLTEFIKEVQAAIGAEVDGIVGNETINKTVTLSRWKNRKHPVVAAVQKRLIALGYDVGAFGADGVFGNDTASAVKSFQSRNGCAVDGEITARNKTWCKLLGII